MWSGMNLFSNYKHNYKAFGLFKNAGEKRDISHGTISSWQCLTVFRSHQISGAAPLLSLPLFCPPAECISYMDDRQIYSFFSLSLRTEALTPASQTHFVTIA